MSKLALLPLLLLVSALILDSTEAFLPPFRTRSCPADQGEPWTYRGRNGPKNWAETYDQCNGENQSPIDISTQDAVEDENLAKLALNGYEDMLTKATVENNGHSIEVRLADDVNRTISVEGVTYELRHFHFHWGRKYCKGSEHTVDGRRYTMEMHLVHFSDNGDIAVVGIFFEEQAGDNEDLRPIVEQLPKLQYKGSQTEMTTPLALNSLLPANPASFYRYDGSLTTPGCAEGVKWSVLKDTMPIGKGQMNEFRKLSSAAKENATSACKLSSNFRPLQPLNGRKVSKSQ